MKKQTISKFLKTLGFVAALCFSGSINAQAPDAIPYQGVARDGSGNILATQNISLRISIRDLTAGGTVLFTEIHNVATTNLGLFNVNIGQGTPVTGTLAGVNWGSGAKFIQVEMDATGGVSYTDMGTTQLMSVPYALFAGSSGNIPSGTANGNTLRWNGTQWVADNAIYNNGTNVGIGTTTPAWKLHLAGTVTGLQIQDTDDASSIFLFAPGAGYTGGVGTTTNHDLALFTNNLDRMTIKAGTGNVGIGTLTPSEKLDVVGKTKTTNFQMTNGAAANTILTGDASGNAAWTAVSSLSIIEVDPEVSSSTTNRVPKWNGTSLTDGIITDNGNNVGIGTSSPTRKLHLSGTIADLRIDDSDDGSSIWLSAPGAGYTGGVGTTSNHDLALFTNSVDRMTVKAGTGNVGIGTLTPSEKLDVVGKIKSNDFQMTNGASANSVLTGDASGNAAWTPVSSLSIIEVDPEVSSSTTNRVPKWNGTSLTDGIITDNGNNVGIGTSSPTRKLHLSGTIADLRIDDSDDGSSIWLSAPGAGYTGGVGTTSNHDLALFTNSIDRMTVKAGTGNVGIGTLNPSTKLEVIAPGNNIGVQILSGDPNQLTYLSVGRTTSEAQFGVTTSGTFFLDATPGDLAIKNFGITPGKILLGSSFIDNSAMAIVPGGKVGIGTTTPDARLEVRAPGNNKGVEILSGDPNQLTYLSVGRTTSEAQFGVTTNSTFFLDATPGDLAIKNFGLTPGKILLGASYIDNSAMAIVPGNKVGIGTTNPSEKLEVINNSTTAVGRFRNSNSAGYSALDFMDHQNNLKLGIGFANSSSIFMSGNSYIHSLSAPLILVTSNIERMRVEMNGNIGIGTTNPQYTLDIEGRENVTHSVQSGYNNSNIITNSTSAFFPRIALQYNATNNGASIAGNSLGELNVISNTTNNYTSVNASGFVVISDRRMKNNITTITDKDYDFYLNQIRSIESAKFLYNYEKDRKVPHIGVISQSLPVELQSTVDANPEHESEKRIGVSLADMAGLTMVGVKALDHNQQKMQTKIEEQEKQINELIKTVETLKIQIESLNNSK